MNAGRKRNGSIATKSITTIATVILASMIMFSLVLATTTSATAIPFQNAPLSISSNDSGNNANNNKVLILGFSDNPKSQFVNAKPILDQYGFKATFFVICNKVGLSDDKMTWQDIATLQNEGHDIQSHSMNHERLNELSASELDFEVGQSKKCLADHGINSTIFESPHGAGWDNSTVINTIAKYYEFGRQGYQQLMFLHCDGYIEHSSQKDCRTYSDDGTLTFANRYSIRGWSHNTIDQDFSFDDDEILDEFVERVERPSKHNTNGTLNAVSIIGYHRIDNDRHDTSTDIDAFAEEMKYLYDNGFTVLPMSSLKYNYEENYFYLNDNRLDSGSTD